METALPAGPGGATLRCFRPPPDAARSPGGEGPPKAWTRELDAGQVEELRSLAGSIRLVPFEGPEPGAAGETVELALSSGGAEARLRWWSRRPGGWSEVERFVERIRVLGDGDDG